jgi:hypothetical protein
MNYTITEAAEMLDMSYSGVYAYVRDFNLGGDEKHKLLSTTDLEFIKQERYLKSRKKTKIKKLEDRVESLEADIARINLILEGTE